MRLDVKRINKRVKERNGGYHKMICQRGRKMQKEGSETRLKY